MANKSSIMRLLCSGSDLEKMERTRKELARMGIACELRRDIPVGNRADIPSYPELWIKTEEDFTKAVTVFSRFASVY